MKSTGHMELLTRYELERQLFRLREALQQIADGGDFGAEYPQEGNYEDFARYYWPEVMKGIRAFALNALKETTEP